MKRYYYSFLLATLFLSALVLGLSSCESNPEVTIPSYIKIDSIALNTDYATQGSARAKMVDAWIYVDNQSLGAYTLPTSIPIQGTGSHSIKIRGGVILNGVSGTRVQYEFYAPYTQTVQLEANKTVTMNPVVKYTTDAVFKLREDFESGISFEPTDRSEKSISFKRLYKDSAVYEGNSSGVISFDSDTSRFFEAFSIAKFTLQKFGNPAYIEINYNCNNKLIVGLVANEGSNVKQVPVVALVPTKGVWKKAYVDLMAAASANPRADSFQIFLGASKDDGVTKPVIYLDNIKVVSN